jgi:hypothetical protein
MLLISYFLLTYLSQSTIIFIPLSPYASTVLPVLSVLIHRNYLSNLSPSTVEPLFYASFTLDKHCWPASQQCCPACWPAMLSSMLSSMLDSIAGQHCVQPPEISLKRYELSIKLI